MGHRDGVSNSSSGVLVCSKEGVWEQKLGELALEMSKVLSSLNGMEETLRCSLEPFKPSVQPGVPCFPFLDFNCQTERPIAPDLEPYASALTSAISTGPRSNA